MSVHELMAWVFFGIGATIAFAGLMWFLVGLVLVAVDRVSKRFGL